MILRPVIAIVLLKPGFIVVAPSSLIELDVLLNDGAGAAAGGEPPQLALA
nr:hypothetical protein [Vibrio cholerae]